MITVWKFKLPIDQDFTLEMPMGALYGRVDSQNGIGVLWAQVDTNKQNQTRRLGVFGTGQPIPEGSAYIGTWQDELGLVWHLFGLF